MVPPTDVVDCMPHESRRFASDVHPESPILYFEHSQSSEAVSSILQGSKLVVSRLESSLAAQSTAEASSPSDGYSSSSPQPSSSLSSLDLFSSIDSSNPIELSVVREEDLTDGEKELLAGDTSSVGSSFPIFSDLHSQPSSDSYSYSSPASYEMTPDSSPNSSLNSNSHSSSFPSGYDLEASGTLEVSVQKSVDLLGIDTPQSLSSFSSESASSSLSLSPCMSSSPNASLISGRVRVRVRIRIRV